MSLPYIHCQFQVSAGNISLSQKAVHQQNSIQTAHHRTTAMQGVLCRARKRADRVLRCHRHSSGKACFPLGTVMENDGEIGARDPRRCSSVKDSKECVRICSLPEAPSSGGGSIASRLGGHRFPEGVHRHVSRDWKPPVCGATRPLQTETNAPAISRDSSHLGCATALAICHSFPFPFFRTMGDELMSRPISKKTAKTHPPRPETRTQGIGEIEQNQDSAQTLRTAIIVERDLIDNPSQIDTKPIMESNPAFWPAQYNQRDTNEAVGFPNAEDWPDEGDNDESETFEEKKMRVWEETTSRRGILFKVLRYRPRVIVSPTLVILVHSSTSLNHPALPKKQPKPTKNPS
ncbi:hypothetical protein VP01_2994g1 [Puccinia sorghi]|uniref:Uncharacterized protein n=1 Tax=Puccinia sorghi TaxID=27349 RepID=A0A0L6V269_9BASI|nr:hypothetical protein VP01_2994g1 [Puccinia sorghi]